MFRCSVDGKRLPDFEAYIGDDGIDGADEVSHSWTRPKDSLSYTFHHYGVWPGFSWGTKADLAKAYGKDADR